MAAAAAGAPPPPARPPRSLVADIVLNAADGSRYVGEMEAGERHGRGFLVYHDGSTFEGTFVRGLRCGQGLRTFPHSGVVFHGCYWRDHRHGAGWEYGEDGSEWYGWYHNDERHGCASLRWPRGLISDRQYEHGRLVSERHVDASVTEWPPTHSKLYNPLEGRVAHLQFFADAAALVCVVGSWDGFTKPLPLGINAATGMHSLSTLLPRGTHRVRFSVNGATPVAVPGYPLPLSADGLDHLLAVDD